MGEGRQHLFDIARHRPRLLGPAGLLADRDEIDELALPNVITDHKTAVAGPLVHMEVVIILRQRIAGRQRAPTHRSRVAWAFAAENAGTDRRADAVATHDDVGFAAGAVVKRQANGAIAGFDRRASLAELDALLRHGLREQAMQVAAVDDVIFGAVALFEIDEGQTVVDLARIPIAPGQSDRLGPDGMELADKSDRLKEFHRVGADVDAGAELGEFGGLLVDLHLETLAAQRDGCRQATEARSDNCNATRPGHPLLRD